MFWAYFPENLFAYKQALGYNKCSSFHPVLCRSKYQNIKKGGKDNAISNNKRNV